MSRVRSYSLALLLLAGLSAATCPLWSPALAQDKYTSTDTIRRSAVKWEYMILDWGVVENLGRRAGARTQEDGLTWGLSKLGTDGWELAAIDIQDVGSQQLKRYVFKRAR